MSWKACCKSRGSGLLHHLGCPSFQNASWKSTAPDGPGSTDVKFGKNHHPHDDAMWVIKHMASSARVEYGIPLLSIAMWSSSAEGILGISCDDKIHLVHPARMTSPSLGWSRCSLWHHSGCIQQHLSQLWNTPHKTLNPSQRWNSQSIRFCSRLYRISILQNIITSYNIQQLQLSFSFPIWNILMSHLQATVRTSRLPLVHLSGTNTSVDGPGWTGDLTNPHGGWLRNPNHQLMVCLSVYPMIIHYL